jgi:lysozyme family protein
MICSLPRISDMKENFDPCFELVLKHEGGYVNDPRDPGGRTNLGVTQRAWESYVGSSVTEEFMRKLTPDQVKPFYKAMYWDKIKGDQLPSGVDYAAYDLAVNSGVGRAAKYLQEIAGVPADGVIGPKSMEAILACDPEQTADALCDMRLEFLKRLPTFETFGKGWSRRVAEVKLKATSMA